MIPLDPIYCGKAENGLLHPFWPMAYIPRDREVLWDIPCQQWTDGILTECDWGHTDEWRVRGNFSIHHLRSSQGVKIETQEDYTAACLKQRERLVAAGFLRTLDPAGVSLTTGRGVINDYATAPIKV